MNAFAWSAFVFLHRLFHLVNLFKELRVVRDDGLDPVLVLSLQIVEFLFHGFLVTCALLHIFNGNFVKLLLRLQLLLKALDDFFVVFSTRNNLLLLLEGRSAEMKMVMKLQTNPN